MNTSENIQIKLERAKRFLQKLENSQNDRQEFEDNLDSFLSISRSVFQFACEEIKSKNDQTALDWYKNFVSGNEVIKIFKKIRNINIHEKPINPKAQIKIGLQDKVEISDSLSSVLLRNGKIIEERPPKQKKDFDGNSSEQSLEIKYFFNEWPENDDVLSLCAIYIKEIENFILEGHRKNIF